ncbi:MAG TPA: 23S rRNA (uracil(1939)-C(5))-methyltransferase RlmD [Elusimicrobia bacterium]|nr:23S rRNA (uracil(1939)-C(5))-methyltransferase RlmD [Elusimicrobiota bacterium]HBT60858.1 23S rRNA (uracil(1939)-C(5))-methyltransferase RlmD [Elusimicrobiota bacterium]
MNVSPPSQKLIVRVLRMAAEGEAVAKAEGSPRVVFVAGGAPGDLCEVEVVAAKSSFARARLLRLIEPGPERIDPACPLHAAPGRPGPACGGCDWQHLRYDAQLKHKTSLIRDCLERIAKLKDIPVLEALASPKPWAYRNKVQVPFGPPPPGSKRPSAGFYAAGSHRIVDFEACPVQPELSVRLACRVKDLAAEFDWPVYDPASGRGWLRHLFVRTNAQGQAAAALVTRTPDLPKAEPFISRMRAEFPQLVGLHQNVQPEKTSVILGPRWKCLWGSRAIEEKLGRFCFQASPGAFLQVNTEAAVLLYDAALAALSEGSPRWSTLLDLYCGVGTLALWLSGAAQKVVGIEENPDAVRDAWKNAERNRVRNARFRAGRAESLLPRLAKDGLAAPCAAVVDPPRAGLTVPVLRFLTGTAIRRVVYVSCNPATFARDAAYLCRSGYKLLRVQPVDLFPQTSHVELVGLLDRGS